MSGTIPDFHEKIKQKDRYMPPETKHLRYILSLENIAPMKTPQGRGEISYRVDPILRTGPEGAY